MNKKFSFAYQLFASPKALEPALQELVHAARQAASLAWAPYSHFCVGAALLLRDGRILPGANQENAAFPAGLCAERVALSAANILAPGEVIKAIAICYEPAEPSADQDRILPPCGICRQSLREQTDRQAQALKVLMIAPSGKCMLVADANDLLPFGFSADSL